MGRGIFSRIRCAAHVLRGRPLAYHLTVTGGLNLERGPHPEKLAVVGCSFDA